MIISRFNSLTDTHVEETLTLTWADIQAMFTAEPTTVFAGRLGEAGWSPVTYDPPQRLKANVRTVYVLVLDHDTNADWDGVATLWAGTEHILYTTKRHGVEGTRLRVVAQLSRDITVDEHAKLWAWANRRSVAASLPIDDNAKDASRFWFNPTVPPGGWRSVAHAGKPIDVDAVLAMAEAPTLRIVQPYATPNAGDRERRAVKYVATLPGAVSGSGGHTATFHAVCTVMFGFDLDESTTLSIIASEYNTRCDPPWSERELQHKVSSAGKLSNRPRGYLLTERPKVATSRQASASAPPLSDDLSTDWADQLLTKKDHSPKKTYTNTAIFVRLFPQYRGKWTLDEMTGQPWFAGQPLQETLIHEIRAHIEQRMGYTPGRDDVEAAITAAAAERPFHPIRQYLRSLDWDGVPRTGTLAADYLGATEPVHGEMVRRWMISAVARAMRPGCKVDTALMLVGGQGVGKSTFFSILGGEWHADSFIDLANKDSYGQIHSAWIYELSELENVVHGRAESRLKAWITSSCDMFRAPYQRVAAKRQRSVVLCGTTNRGQFLTDDTGSRRFWIVPVSQHVPRNSLAQRRDLLWAEAVAAYEAGEVWWFDDLLETARESSNADYQEEDPWTEPVRQYLMNINDTSTAEVLTFALKIDAGRQTRFDQTRAGRVVLAFGWRKYKSKKLGWRYASN